MQFILYKDNASERNVSLLANCRVQLILYKDNANRIQNIFCKVTKNPRELQLSF